ncbi:MAG: MBOAT family protein [Anaerolineae bacterium]|nr:MBOAT family protein [Anaerolineae bacterium]
MIFFKYNDFFLLEIQNALIQLGIDYQLTTLHIIFPLGLSFYTLKKFAYILDVARQNIVPETNFINFALFVAFFPQITSGPIDRAQNLLSQIQSERKWSRSLFNNAWPLILMGFFKKLVIADSLAVVVDKIFTLQQPSILLVLIGAFGFTFQLLTDFSAYTDLSRGISFLLGFRTPENFKSPYLSITPTDFWNRWHITLSEWLRDYIFFPVRRLCLRIKSRASKQIALIVPPLITMLASGFWHGTGWTYIVWGVYYGLLIVIYQIAGFGGAWKPNNRFKLAAAWMLMFGLIMFGWLIFRSPSIEWLVNIGRHSQFVQSSNEIFVAVASLSTITGYIAPLLIKHFVDAIKKDAIRNWVEPLFYAVALTATVVYINSSTPDFIYFQF